MSQRANQPIGVFDSGIGGLTVAKAIKELMPHEQIIYFGDTAHLPYGDKSTAAIQAYSIKICDVLLQRGCKVIVIACNSASSAAFELVKAYVGTKAGVFDVIRPVIDYLRERKDLQEVGLIGTRQTVSSGVYQQLMKEDAKKNCHALATPLLVPMIEEGWIHNRISHQIIENYLKEAPLSDVEALVLGCTHYPLIAGEIQQYYGGKVEVIDSARVVAQSLKAYLDLHYLSRNEPSLSSDHFLVSDLTDNFQAVTKLFFGAEVPLEAYPLWE
jgi:glutamate racemase